MKNRWHAAAAVLIALSIGRAASADEKQVCVDAYKKAQDLKDSSSLLAARDSLRACGNASCTAFIVKDCTDWLGEVEKRIPSVVFVAKTNSGKPVTDVELRVGGKRLATVDGKSRELDPGSYDFEFVAADGRRVVVKESIYEGRKGQFVTATFPDSTSGAAAEPSQPTSVAPQSSAGRSVEPTTLPNATDSKSANERGSAQPWLGIGVASAGAIAIAVGSVVFAGGVSKYDDAVQVCTLGATGQECPAAQKPSIDAAADDSGKQKRTGLILIGVGGAALVGGGVLLVTSLSAKSERPAARSPVRLDLGVGTLMLSGEF